MSEKHESLEFIFSNVNEWLKFAEAKNGALIAVCAGLLSIAFDELREDEHIFNDYYLYFFIAFCTLSLITGLSSFIPRIKKLKSLMNMQASDDKNIIYFGHLSKMSSSSLLTELDIAPATKYERSLSEQIINNSQIAIAKYEMFRIGIWFLLAAVLTPVIALIGVIFSLKREEQ